MSGKDPSYQPQVVMLVTVLLGRILGNQPLAVLLRLLSWMSGKDPSYQPQVVMLVTVLLGRIVGHQPLAVFRIIRVVSKGRRVTGGSEPWRGDW
jgi:hypothetical protein